MSSIPTVGLLAPNGRVGAATLTALVKAQEAGKLNLVVLHRPGSPPKAKVPSSVSVREIDISGDVEAMVPTLKGINTLVSALGPEGMVFQANLVEAFSKSPDHVTFVPAAYGHPATPEELTTNAGLAAMAKVLGAAMVKAQELAVGLTHINAAGFDEYVFAFGFTHIDLKENSMQANAAQLENRFPIVTMPYLAAGIAEVVSKPAESIKGKQYALLEYQPTGQELVELLTEINGSKPTVRDYTEEDRQREIQTPPLGPVTAGYMASWARGKWCYQGEFRPQGFESKPLAEVASSWK